MEQNTHAWLMPHRTDDGIQWTIGQFLVINYHFEAAPPLPKEFYRPLTKEITEGDIIRAEKIRYYLQEENDFLRTMLHLAVDVKVDPEQDTRFVRITGRNAETYCPDDYDIDTLEYAGLCFDTPFSKEYYNVLTLSVRYPFVTFDDGQYQLIIDGEERRIKNRQRMLEVKKHTSVCISLEMENAALRQFIWTQYLYSPGPPGSPGGL